MPVLALSPYLSYPDAAAAIEWLQRTFGWGPVKRYPAEGPVAEAEVTVAPGIAVHLKGAEEGDAASGERGDTIILITDNADEIYERARSTGLDIAAPEVEFYGPKVLYV